MVVDVVSSDTSLERKVRGVGSWVKMLLEGAKHCIALYQGHVGDKPGTLKFHR